MTGIGLLCGHLIGDYIVQNDWMAANKVKSSWACLAHCVLYTLAVWACSFWWMPLWGLVVVFATHFPIDRWRLAYKWMQYSGQKVFSSKEHPMFPWSIVAVDNTIHLVTLFIVGVIHAGI